VPLLQQQDLEHHKRRIAGRASGRSVGWSQQSFERRPIERLLDPVQKSAALPAPAHHRIHERRLRQVTARHRRIIHFGFTSENQTAPTSAKLSFHYGSKGVSCWLRRIGNMGATAAAPRHGRPCAGHPRRPASKTSPGLRRAGRQLRAKMRLSPLRFAGDRSARRITWMAWTSQAMTPPEPPQGPNPRNQQLTPLEPITRLRASSPPICSGAPSLAPDPMRNA
jgi:hypothetical protein